MKLDFIGEVDSEFLFGLQLDFAGSMFAVVFTEEVELPQSEFQFLENGVSL